MKLSKIKYNGLFSLVVLTICMFPALTQGIGPPTAAPGSSATTTVTPTYTSKAPPFDPNTEDSSMTSATSIDLEKGDPVSTIYLIINIFLTFLGIAFLVLLVYAGTLWVIARGNSEEIEKAKHLIRQSVIGLIIILSAYGVANIVFGIIELFFNW